MRRKLSLPGGVGRGVGLVLAAVAASVSAAPAPVTASFDTGRAGRQSITECPATFDTTGGRPHSSRTGTLVPAGAISAVLCRYPFTDRSRHYPLAASLPRVSRVS